MAPQKRLQFGPVLHFIIIIPALLFGLKSQSSGVYRGGIKTPHPTLTTTLAASPHKTCGIIFVINAIIRQILIIVFDVNYNFSTYVC